MSKPSGILKKWKCTIKDYPLEIKVSDKRRETHWTVADKASIPKKYGDVKLFDYDNQGILINLTTGEKVIKNIKTAGKPRMLTINAQKIYVGIHHSVRSKIVNELHTLFNKEFKKQLPAKIDTTGKKIMIGLHFHDVYSGKMPDLDNLSNLFIKTGIDCLTQSNNPNQTKSGGVTHKLGIIEDDKIFFIPHIFVEFTNVDKIEDRKLDFMIYEVSADFKIEEILNTIPCQNQLSLQD